MREHQNRCEHEIAKMELRLVGTVKLQPPGVNFLKAFKMTKIPNFAGPAFQYLWKILCYPRLKWS